MEAKMYTRATLVIAFAVSLAGCASTAASSISNSSGAPSPSKSIVSDKFFPTAGSLCALVKAKDASGIVGEELLTPADSQAQQSTSDSCYFGVSPSQNDYELGYIISTKFNASEIPGYWDSYVKDGIQCGGSGTFEVKLGEKSTGCSVTGSTVINIFEKSHLISVTGRGGSITRSHVESLGKLLLSRLP